MGIGMIGRFATSRAGHDRDQVYVVVGQAGDFVYLSDGRLKPPDRPKRKRLKHVQPINAHVEASLLQKLRNGEKVYAEEIKYALKQYARQHMPAQSK